MKNLILASTSTLHGQSYLEYLLPRLEAHFSNAREILFIPFARPGGISHDDYTEHTAKAFKKLGKTVVGLHTFENPKQAIADTAGIFTGGGNTFVLVNALYKLDLLFSFRESILNGTPYLGTSAGSNIAGLTMQTSNDMPIVHTPSLKTLGLVPFNINPHYQDAVAGSQHMGETRETRIKEFHAINTISVIGLREGSWLEVHGKSITLEGALKAKMFQQGKEAYEMAPGVVPEGFYG